jgi:hypothetical protein
MIKNFFDQFYGVILPNGFVSGGAALALAWNYEPSDIDIYPRTKEHAAALLFDLVGAGLVDLQYRFCLKYECVQGQLGGYKCQVFADDYRKLFDIKCCQAWVNSELQVMDIGPIEEIPNNVIRNSTKSRINKYQNRYKAYEVQHERKDFDSRVG